MIFITAFTAEQMSKLSDILEAALPPATSSPVPHAASPQPISRSCAPAHPLQSSRKYNSAKENNAPFGDLAKEFGVDAQIVEALAQRLSLFA